MLQTSDIFRKNQDLQLARCLEPSRHRSNNVCRQSPPLPICHYDGGPEVLTTIGKSASVARHQFWSSHTCKTSLANQGVCMAIPKHAIETLHCLEQRYTKLIQNLRFGIMDRDTTIKGSHDKSIVFPAPDDRVSLPQDSALEQAQSPLIGLEATFSHHGGQGFLHIQMEKNVTLSKRVMFF